MMCKRDLYVNMFSIYFMGSRTSVLNLSELNILCTRETKPYYTQNNNSPFTVMARLCVLQCTVLYQSGVIQMSKGSVLHQK